MLKIPDLIFLAETNENTIMAEWFKKLEKIIKDNPNDFDLGYEIRKLL